MGVSKGGSSFLRWQDGMGFVKFNEAICLKEKVRGISSLQMRKGHLGMVVQGSTSMKE